MSHVDEGRLHAFLDGALSAADPADAERVELHLAACADCRARLDEAARVRDEANALLGIAQPRAVTMPSFDAIRARADAIAGAGEVESKEAIFGAWGRRSRSRRRAFLATPFNGVAWAATVVLAVGLGWLLRDSAGDGDRSAITDMSGGALAERGRAFDVQVEAAEGGQLSSDAAAVEAPAEVPHGFQTLSPPTAAPPRTLETEELRVATTQAAARERASADYDVVAEEAADVAAPPPPVAQSTLDARDFSGQGAAAGEDAARRSEIRNRAAPQAAPAPNAAESAAGATTGEAGLRTVSIAEAERLLGGELLRIDYARIASASARGSGSDVEVRTMQVTTRGENVTVFQRLAPERVLQELPTASRAEAERPMLAESQSALTMRVGKWTVTMGAAVDSERLEQLAEQLH